ncbi:hypothetical protein Tco_1029216 [Tanacetum coccineum]|uniref:Uncharacterized protein n=1 Tax=Tanacetum coccineum TaxID=301880 RepID=A0ABQ5G483_9ASTR
MNNDTPMCEVRKPITSNLKVIEKQNSQDDSHSHQSHHDRNDSEKSLTELNNDVRNDLEDFKRCIHSMRTVHWKLFAKDDGKTTKCFTPKTKVLICVREGKHDELKLRLRIELTLNAPDPCPLHMIVAGADNHPPMLEKTMYNSWQNHMLLYIKGNVYGRMMLNSVLNGPLVYGTIEVDGVTRLKTYDELRDAEKL